MDHPVKPLQEVVFRIYGERFGVPTSILNQYVYFQRSDMIWLTTWEQDYRAILGKHFQMQGIRIIRYTRYVQKPTTAGIQFFSRWICRHRVDFENAEGLRHLLMQGKIPASHLPDPLQNLLKDFSPGYVVLVYRGIPLGCGEWTSDGFLKHHIPSRRLPELLQAVDLQS